MDLKVKILKDRENNLNGIISLFREWDRFKIYPRTTWSQRRVIKKT
jgi:5'-deoxynucleotidase YfbR-like HD superfamily hydrolase